MASSLEGKRIFIAEDDMINMSVYSSALKTSGAIIYQDVLGYGIVNHILENLPIDLIILDLMLKRGISGYEIYDQIRNNDQLKDVPVVVVSSMDPETEIPKAKALGINGFIAKPIGATSFANLLGMAIGGQKIWVAGR